MIPFLERVFVSPEERVCREQHDLVLSSLPAIHEFLRLLFSCDGRIVVTQETSRSSSCLPTPPSTGKHNLLLSMGYPEPADTFRTRRIIILSQEGTQPTFQSSVQSEILCQAYDPEVPGHHSHIVNDVASFIYFKWILRKF